MGVSQNPKSKNFEKNNPVLAATQAPLLASAIISAPALSIVTSNIDIIWFDENITNSENKKYINDLKLIVNSCLSYNDLEEGFKNYYSNIFTPIFTIVSGKLWGRYLQLLKKNINKIINIPYTVIFTSKRFRNILIQKTPEEEHILSYDTLNEINDSFYNPGGVISSFNELKSKIESFKLGKKDKVQKRKIDKKNFEGVLTFEYLESEDDLLAPALYKEIITNEPIKEEEIKRLIDYFLSYDNKHLNNLYFNLKNFENIPLEIFSKYSSRTYTYETEFYKTLNNDLMKSKINDYYKTFIKILYNGIEIKSFSSFTGIFLYRGSMINKSEVIKILDYKKEGKLKNIVAFSKAFLSFSEIESEAMKFLKNSNNIFLRILFILENYNINNQESNADIQKFSAFAKEKEILFFPGSSFIIEDIIYKENEDVRIILNYNGKFKEKYNVFYGNKTKINELLKRNIITKSVAGKELEFLSNGKYLIIETVSDKKVGFIKRIMKAKDLKNNEMVYIKEIYDEDNASYDEKYFTQLTYLLKKLNESNNSCTLRDLFTLNNNAYYMAVDIYDDNLANYLKRIKPKGLPPNLIQKIMFQLRDCFEKLLGEFGERSIIPENILIKYANQKKNNFDVFLSENGIYEFDNTFFSYFYYHPSIVRDKIIYPRKFASIAPEQKMKHELFNIGISLYELYFNNLPFFKEKDYLLYKKYVIESNSLNKNDVMEYPQLKELFLKIQVNKWHYTSSEKKEALLLDITERRDNWIKSLTKYNIIKKNDFYKDDLFYDLLYRLIKYDSKENINNYKDFYSHPFFSQYKY